MDQRKTVRLFAIENLEIDFGGKTEKTFRNLPWDEKLTTKAAERTLTYNLKELVRLGCPFDIERCFFEAVYSKDFYRQADHHCTQLMNKVIGKLELFRFLLKEKHGWDDETVRKKCNRDMNLGDIEYLFKKGKHPAWKKMRMV